METSVIVAVIGLFGGVLVALIQKGRKENKTDHNVVADLLRNVHDDVVKVEDKLDHVEDKLDNHISQHKVVNVTAKATKTQNSNKK